MTITPEELTIIIKFIGDHANQFEYDIDDFNCADFAIRVFNTVRYSDPIIVPRDLIRRGNTFNGSSSPQGLYKEMSRRMRMDKMPGVTFSFPQYRAYAEATKIPCK